MEEKKGILLGIYIMGIKKRPELANRPCVLQYIENYKKLVLSVTVNEHVENIIFDQSKIMHVKNVVRTIVSQDEFKDNSVNESDVRLLAHAISIGYGGLFAELINRSGLLKKSNSGAVTYTSINELHITYMNDENEQRDLIIQTDLNPDDFIDCVSTK